MPSPKLTKVEKGTKTMMAKFAKAIASNITKIAVCTTHIALIDEIQDKSNEHFAARVDLVAQVKKAERNIAALLQEPGCHKLD